MAFKNPTRKAVIKQQPVRTVKKFNVAQFAGIRHQHQCANRECRQVFWDYCTTPQTNPVCPICKTGRPNVYMQWKEPKECCLEGCELLTDHQWHEWLELAGEHPWYQCDMCKRAHGSSFR